MPIIYYKSRNNNRPSIFFQKCFTKKANIKFLSLKGIVQENLHPFPPLVQLSQLRAPQRIKFRQGFHRLLRSLQLLLCLGPAGFHQENPWCPWEP